MEIEKGVPMPAGIERRGRKSAYRFDDLEDHGDSFVIPIGEQDALKLRRSVIAAFARWRDRDIMRSNWRLHSYREGEAFRFWLNTESRNGR